MSPENLPPHFSTIKDRIVVYQAQLKKSGIDLQTAALNFVKQIDEVDVILLGIDSLEQLESNINAYRTDVSFDYSGYAVDDEKIVNPVRWPQT